MRKIAIFHLSVKIIGRSSGRSAIGAAAYRSGERLLNEQDNKIHDYTIRRGAVAAAAYRAGERIDEHDFIYRKEIVYSEIMLPSHAPKVYYDRSTLWNSVQEMDNARNARLSREVVVALPNELDEDERVKLVQDYVQRNFVDKGMCADFSIHAGHIHDKKDEVYPFQDLTIRKENPHAHIMLTVRPINKDGTWGEKSRKEYILDRNGNREKTAKGNWKCRKIDLTDWDKTETLMKWREDWARICNEKFKEKGLDERISHLSLKEQGIDREPTKHMGHNAWNKEKKGFKTKIGNENREIYRKNMPEKTAEYMHGLKEKYFNLHMETSAIKAQSKPLEREIFTLKLTAEEIAEQADNIKNTKKQLDELNAQRQEMGFWTSKKDINNEIQKVENSHEQAVAFFEQKYNLSPEKATAEMARLERKTADNMRVYEQLQSKLEPLKQQENDIKFEYQKQKILADISHDKQKIDARLDELEKQSRPPKFLPQYVIEQAKNQQVLDRISDRNLELIFKELSPEKQKALIKMQEDKREIARFHGHGRGW